jgi:hypothetical protein
MSVDVQQAPRFIRYTVTGEWPTIAEHREIRRGLIAQGLLTTATRGLFDIRMAASTPSYTEVGDIVTAAKDEGSLPLLRAYLVGTAVQHGLVRQMQALAPPSVVLDVFTDEREAMAWLWRDAIGS